MFRNLAHLMAPAGQSVFDVHPLQLSRWLDEAWAGTATVPAFGPFPQQFPFLGSNEIVGAIDLPSPTGGAVPLPVPSGVDTTAADRFNGAALQVGPGLIWDHLVYAYLIESTGVFEIMAEVVRRYGVGESLDPPTPQGARWLRSTEELFFRDPPLYSIQGVVSQLRPDHRIARRNAYWRMFGFEPPHPVPARWTQPGAGDAPWRLDTGEGVNTGFQEKWTELLRQVWLGIENANNGIGPNATDKEYVAFLCTSLRDMLAMRRRRGTLAREEFAYVTTMSWFHLTLESDTPLVAGLNATGPAPADRLAKIAQRVGMTPAPRSRELFELADLMSGLLRALEVGLFGTGPEAELLYLNRGTNTDLISDMNRIIDLWQSATGDRVKDRPTGSPAQPTRLPNAAARPVPQVPGQAPAPTTAGRNGHG